MVNNTQQLTDWCEDQLASPVELNPLSGDASFRRYYRVAAAGQNHIAVYAPPDKEKNHEFVSIASSLSEGGVAVPKVLAVDFEQGFMLQQDLGDQLLLPLLSDESVDQWYTKAFGLLLQMLSLPGSKLQSLPAYDRDLLQTEMALFPEWFIDQMLGVSLSVAEQQMLQQLFDTLVSSALSQPQVFVHRDFHARNLMVFNDELYTIDFQDAVQGPVTYDVVSLLRDCYLRWPDQKVYQWLEQFRLLVTNTPVKGDCLSSAESFRRAFDLMGLQRHIKVLGIFARLFIRDGKQGYLGDLPRVISYTLDVASLYPEFSHFVEFFQSRLMPAVRGQEWWNSENPDQRAQP